MLTTLTLTDFRGYDALALELGTGLTVFAGDNAQGKTNLLRAAELLALGDARGAGGEAVRFGREEAVVEGRVARDAVEDRLAVRCLAGGGVRLRANGKAVARPTFVGRCPVLYVGPEDREQVAGPPAARRALLDGLLEQSEPAYLLALREYRRALRQRNRALARPGAPDGEIEIWDEPLAQAGGEVLARRVAAVEALAPRAAAWHRELAAADGGGASLAVAYSGTAGRPAGGGAAGWAAALLAALAAGRDRDRATGTTGAGPHRDDVALALDGRPMKGTASSGEIWTAILSLTLAAAERLGERLGRLPALLLDDVLAALDGARRARVLAVLREFPQALLATTDAPPSAWPGTVFAVRAHRVTRIPAAAGGEDTAWERRPDPALSARC